MRKAVIVSAVRTAIGTSFKGTLAQTPPERLATHVLRESIRRAGISADDVDDVILAESQQGGGDIARYAALEAGMPAVPGHAVNRHCAGSLTSVAIGAAAVMSGMADAVVAGGVQSSSLAPTLRWQVPGRPGEFRDGMAPTHHFTDGAGDDVTLTVGWNVAQKYGLTRDDMDAWAVRSHVRACAAIDAGRFADEVIPFDLTLPTGECAQFATDEHPRRDTSIERLAQLKPLHPEIEGFSITAGNASGINDGAAALTVVGEEYARAHGLPVLASVLAWSAVGVEPTLTGTGAIAAIERVLDRAGLSVRDIAMWEINEAFASVPWRRARSSASTTRSSTPSAAVAASGILSRLRARACSPRWCTSSAAEVVVSGWPPCVPVGDKVAPSSSRSTTERRCRVRSCRSGPAIGVPRARSRCRPYDHRNRRRSTRPRHAAQSPDRPATTPVADR